MPDGAINTGLSQESEEETMRKRFFDLQLFTDGGEGGAGAAGAGAGTAGNGNGSQNNAGGATYSYEQAEQIAQDGGHRGLTGQKRRHWPISSSVRE